MQGELAGRVALVTGAAGDGIGSATARRLAQEGAAVAVVGCKASDPRLLDRNSKNSASER